MKAFEDCLEGRFSNKYQAMKQPTRYAHINIAHVRLGDHLFYGEQAYDYNPRQPYRQFILKILPIGDDYIVQNYEVEDPQQHVGCKNLDILREKPLQRRLGCDILFKLDGEMYKGSLAGKECTVQWRGKKTYLKNQIELGDDYYWVLDQGFDFETDRQVWGSEWGFLKFYRERGII